MLSRERCGNVKDQGESIYTVYSGLGVINAVVKPPLPLPPPCALPSPIHTTTIAQSIPCFVRRHPHLSASSTSPLSLVDVKRIYKYTLTCRDGAGRGK